MDPNPNPNPNPNPDPNPNPNPNPNLNPSRRLSVDGSDVLCVREAVSSE